MSLITNSITSVQQQIITNKNITEETIQENRQDTLSAIAANRAETDAQISTNKEKTDAAIQELQQNVLFYEYGCLSFMYVLCHVCIWCIWRPEPLCS